MKQKQCKINCLFVIIYSQDLYIIIRSSITKKFKQVKGFVNYQIIHSKRENLSLKNFYCENIYNLINQVNKKIIKLGHTHQEELPRLFV